MSSITLTSYFIKTAESETTSKFKAEVTPTSISVAKEEVVANFLNLLRATDEVSLGKSLAYINGHWEESYEIMLIESLYFTQNRRFGNKIVRLLEKKTKKNYGYDFDKWFQWIWSKDAAYSDEYYEFKAKSHSLIDTKFRRYFENRADQSTIRLDEVRWGGVLQDGIPPLRGPEMINVAEATYLRDSNIVFGIEVNGDARAYPKRILAWHEMFVDTVGNVPVAGVYCTLCGTVILYKTEHKGVNHAMGTSGFLYRSNKLMYDNATQSLWSTLDGEPVIGPLVGKGIQLEYLSVVTTTWKEWKERHPDTKVLSLNTGHRRDYGEGVAYQQYFATDDLMFTVPKIDRSLKNKDEILAIRLPNSKDNYAISSKYLRKNPIFESKIGAVNYVVFTDKTGAHRVYKSKNLRFTSYDGKSTALDNKGVSWNLTEEGMENANGDTLERFPSHNAFWFGYKAAYPEVQLIH
ncbi:DUF3179 domain-containing protein [Spongiimicrobium salis]|uniref:DUF3179 domain-containing protein n=1 Tax=Spongiimicrobium salis TaxID=1667022 RepID=UPI00374DDB97